jgi:NodT family efflux transporter outer membrane factor (OMF) lipoprotein
MRYSNFTIYSIFPCACIMAGCVAFSPESRIGEMASPTSWAASKEAKAGVDQRWIEKIGGSVLGELVDEAVANNPDLKAAAARLDRAAAEAGFAGSGRLPSLGLGADADRSKQNFTGFPFGGSNISQKFGVQLNASWELDVWGRVKAGQEAAIANAEARKYEYKAAQVSLAAQVAKAWLALGESNEQITLASEGVSASKILADSARERFERALDGNNGSAAQVRLAEVEFANRTQTLAQHKQDRERVLRQLEILLGRYPSGKISDNLTLPKFHGSTPAGLPSELLQRRPDILAAERIFAASGRRVKERKLARFPSLRLTGSGGTTTESVRDVLSSDFGVWAIGGGLTQPIFQGGAIAGEIEVAKADDKENLALLKKTVLAAFGEVEQALGAEHFFAQRESAALQAAAVAIEAAERAGDEYSAGTGDILTLIDATRTKIDNQSRYAAIRRMRLENRIDLHLALGGDFKAEK